MSRPRLHGCQHHSEHLHDLRHREPTGQPRRCGAAVGSRSAGQRHSCLQRPWRRRMPSLSADQLQGVKHASSAAPRPCRAHHACPTRPASPPSRRHSRSFKSRRTHRAPGRARHTPRHRCTWVASTPAALQVLLLRGAAPRTVGHGAAPSSHVVCAVAVKTPGGITARCGVHRACRLGPDGCPRWAAPHAAQRHARPSMRLLRRPATTPAAIAASLARAVRCPPLCCAPLPSPHPRKPCIARHRVLRPSEQQRIAVPAWSRPDVAPVDKELVHCAAVDRPKRQRLRCALTHVWQLHPPAVHLCEVGAWPRGVTLHLLAWPDLF